MKNIHVLPTDKPSKLIFYSTLLNEFQLLDEPIEDWERNKNIYITSDEEIKEGDWFTDNNNSLKTSYKLSHIQFANPKKIILTTDQDLIKDGVQAIDDEFLEWFVKNPSCEYVKIEDYGNLYNFRYLIIIPKEEPKQETLEEVAEQFGNNYENPHFNAGVVYGFIEGAKWQQERMYSEMDIVLILSKFRDMKMIAFSEWFEKFKKK